MSNPETQKEIANIERMYAHADDSFERGEVAYKRPVPLTSEDMMLLDDLKFVLSHSNKKNNAINQLQNFIKSLVKTELEGTKDD